jgi:hypothetical protein
LAGFHSAQAQVYSYQSTIGVTGVSGSDNTHFSNPSAAAVDTANGHFFIADGANNRVQVVDTGTLTVSATIGGSTAGSDNSHFSNPDDVGFDAATGRLFVADTKNQRVQVLDSKTFTYVATIGATGVSGVDNSHFDYPVSARVNTAAHQLYVTDYGNNRVQIYDAATLAFVATLGTTGASGTDNAHFNNPTGADFNPSLNQIMVADQSNFRVQLFDASTFAYVATIGGPGTNHQDNSHFAGPVSAAFDPTTGLVIVNDEVNWRVQVLDGKTYQWVMTLGTTGTPGATNNQFSSTIGIGIDPTHRLLFIGDAASQRVQVFSTAASAIHASVLPGSRSVQVGAPATMFASVINSGSAPLTNCSIGLQSTAPAGLALSYQTTSSATNALTGTPNAPATIPGNNGLQTFLISFDGFKQFSAPGLPLSFSCDGTAPADVIPGVDTVDLVMSSTPIADIIALAATASGNGVAEVPAGGFGAFAVASSNLGVAAPITVSVDTGNAVLPLAVTICQSNPTNGQCIAPPASTVSVSYAAGGTPTFSVFLQASGIIAFDPANSRVFVRFKDAEGGLHGSTSVAVETL